MADATARSKQPDSLRPCIPLISPEPEHPGSTESVSFLLKVRAGAAAGGSTYKTLVRRFDEGTPVEWIATLAALDEIWTQNAVTGAADRAATVRLILWNNALTQFDGSLAEPNTNGNVTLNLEAVKRALGAVTTGVFPHRALEHQKLWMRRGMRKPRDLKMRRMAAAIT